MLPEQPDNLLHALDNLQLPVQTAVAATSLTARKQASSLQAAVSPWIDPAAGQMRGTRH